MTEPRAGSSAPGRHRISRDVVGAALRYLAKNLDSERRQEGLDEIRKQAPGA